MNKIILITLILLALPLSSQASKVSKITRPVSVENGLYKQVTVTCSNFSELRTIRKAEGQSLWCAGTEQEKCSSQKLKAAALACTNSSSKLVKAKEPIKKEVAKKAPNPVVATKPPFKPDAVEETNPLIIEAQLIEIKQQQIELRRKTLEIEKRKLVSLDQKSQ